MANVAFSQLLQFSVDGADPDNLKLYAQATCVVVDDNGNPVLNVSVFDPINPGFAYYFTSADTIETIRANVLAQIQALYNDSTITAVWM